MRITGDIEAHEKAGPERQDALGMYHFMVLARVISRKAWLLNRQGRVLFTMACDGQEAADVGSALALNAGTDFMVPYARDLGAVLVLGMTPREIMLNLFARADDPNSGGRQMPMHCNLDLALLFSVRGIWGPPRIHDPAIEGCCRGGKLGYNYKIES